MLRAKQLLELKSLKYKHKSFGGVLMGLAQDIQAEALGK